MFKLFSKNLLASLLSLVIMNSSLIADECCCPSDCNRLYVGAFGGATYSNSTKLTQSGTAFFTEAVGGPLAIEASGRSRSNSSGFGGVQIGYEWTQCPINIGCTDWSITPAAEVEAYFYKHTKKGLLINPSVRLPEHDFDNSFPMNMGVYLFNGVITLNNCSWGKLSPYIGGGIGAANVHIRRAKSFQVSPPELGVNHFNSRRSDSAWTFAAQAKAGLRYNICERFHIFAEYRFSFVDSSCYTFGSTMYPTHAPTSIWNVEVKHICYNAFAVGLQFDL